MAGSGSMIVRVDLDTSKLDDALTRLEAVLARIESLERGNTAVVHSHADFSAEDCRLMLEALEAKTRRGNLYR